MKNQYFGDVNDYRKYGLLRSLTGQGSISTAVCWMLTPDDSRADGSFTTYLEQSARWRHYDPELFDGLKSVVLNRKRRDVKLTEEEGLLPSMHFYGELLPDDVIARASYFEKFWRASKGCELIFFDPDNGMEVKSKPYGKKDSSKYLYWKELGEASANGHSVLIYQHFPRVQRVLFIDQIVERINSLVANCEVYSFRTAHVVFLFLLLEQHERIFKGFIECLDRDWASQIKVTKHVCA